MGELTYEMCTQPDTIRHIPNTSKHSGGMMMMMMMNVVSAKREIKKGRVGHTESGARGGGRQGRQ